MFINVAKQFAVFMAAAILAVPDVALPCFAAECVSPKADQPTACCSGCAQSNENQQSGDSGFHHGVDSTIPTSHGAMPCDCPPTCPSVCGAGKLPCAPAAVAFDVVGMAPIGRYATSTAATPTGNYAGDLFRPPRV